jgi:hypothetical protein
MMVQAQEDTTNKLWEWYFKVRVPYLQTRDINELRARGVNISGNKDVDGDIKNQWLTTMMPIAYMVELYQKSIPIKVCSVADTKLIYDYISEHLHAWKQQLQRGINVGAAPIDDLIAMDEFANLVYEHARHQFTREIADSIMGKHMQSIHHFNIHNFFNPNVLDKLDNRKDVLTINESQNTTPERETLSDFFKDRIINLGRRWQ